MPIKELKSGQGNVNVQGIIAEIGEIRTFNKFGKELRVANAILKDDSGTIKLTLWNDEISKYKEGDEIKIENGYVNEFQGEPQLTAGKFGKIVLIKEGSGAKKTQAKLSDIEEESEDLGEEEEDESEDLEDEEEVEETEKPEGELSEEEPEEEPEEEASEEEKATEEPEEEEKEKATEEPEEEASEEEV